MNAWELRKKWNWLCLCIMEVTGFHKPMRNDDLDEMIRQVTKASETFREAGERVQQAMGANEWTPTPGTWVHGIGAIVEHDNATFLAVGIAGNPWLPIAILSPADKITDEDRANALLISASKELLAACRDQNTAIDFLMAQLIAVDRTFMPSESRAWPVVVAGNAAIRKATRAATENTA